MESAAFGQGEEQNESVDETVVTLETADSEAIMTGSPPLSISELDQGHQEIQSESEAAEDSVLSNPATDGAEADREETMQPNTKTAESAVSIDSNVKDKSKGKVSVEHSYDSLDGGTRSKGVASYESVAHAVFKDEYEELLAKEMEKISGKIRTRMQVQSATHPFARSAMPCTDLSLASGSAGQGVERGGQGCPAGTIRADRDLFSLCDIVWN